MASAVRGALKRVEVSSGTVLLAHCSWIWLWKNEAAVDERLFYLQVTEAGTYIIEDLTAVPSSCNLAVSSREVIQQTDSGESQGQ